MEVHRPTQLQHLSLASKAAHRRPSSVSCMFRFSLSLCMMYADAPPGSIVCRRPRCPPPCAAAGTPPQSPTAAPTAHPPLHPHTVKRQRITGQPHSHIIATRHSTPAQGPQRHQTEGAVLTSEGCANHQHQVPCSGGPACGGHVWSPGKCQLGACGRSTRFESSSGASGALGSESSGADGSPPLNEPWGPQKEEKAG